jgi:hypothetical protein
MQQRQLRLGDILDDYCPRERRVTNHAIVAMIGPDVKQTRCATCETEHEYKHAKVPRQRRKAETPAALYSQVLAGGPKRVVHESGSEVNGQPAIDAGSNGAHPVPVDDHLGEAQPEPMPEPAGAIAAHEELPDPDHEPDEPADEAEANGNLEEGPVHRPLIRATLPRPEGTPPPTRPAPEFTIRQPTGRQGRFRPRHQRDQRGPSPFQGNRSGNMSGGGMPRQGGGRPPIMSRAGKRHGPGHKRSK